MHKWGVFVINGNGPEKERFISQRIIGLYCQTKAFVHIQLELLVGLTNYFVGSRSYVATTPFLDDLFHWKSFWYRHTIS